MQFRQALFKKGLTEVHTNLGTGSDTVIPELGSGASKSEVKNWVNRSDFFLPKKTVQNKDGKIASYFFFAQNRLAFALHVIYKNTAKNGKAEPFLWVDVAPGINPKVLWRF